MIKRILRLWTRVRRGRRGRPSQAGTPPTRAEPTTDSPPAAPRPPRTRDDIKFSEWRGRAGKQTDPRPIAELEPALRQIAANIRDLQKGAQADGRKYNKSPDAYLAVTNLWDEAYKLLSGPWVIEDGRVMALRNDHAELIRRKTDCLPVSFSTYPSAASDMRDRLIKLWVTEGVGTTDSARSRTAYEVVAQLIQTAQLKQLSPDTMHDVVYGYVMLLGRHYGRTGKIPPLVAAWLIGDLAKRLADTEASTRPIPEAAVLVLAKVYGKSFEAADQLAQLRKGAPALKDS